MPRNSLNYSLECGGKNSIRLTDDNSNNEDVTIKLLNSHSAEEPAQDLELNTVDLEEI